MLFQTGMSPSNTSHTEDTKPAYILLVVLYKFIYNFIQQEFFTAKYDELFLLLFYEKNS